MTFAEELETAIAAMHEDADDRWHAVADLLAGTALGYARMCVNRPDPVAYALNYPDIARGLSVARAYLGN